MVRTVAIAVLVASATVGIASAAEQGRCLRYHDVDRTTLVDASTLIIKAKGGQRYKVSLDQGCKHIDRPDNHFTTRKHESLWECVEPGDAWRLSEDGTCFVQSVTPIADEHAQ